MNKRTLLLTLTATLVHAQDPLKILPNNYRLVFDNPQVRVIDVKYEPHEKLPVHDHPATPTVYVYLTDSGPVRFSHVEEHAFEAIRQPVKAGMFRLSPGRLEKHDAENLGDTPTEFLRVELKRVPLGFQRRDFRDSKPFDLGRSSVSVEFPGPFIKIDRIITAGHRSKEIAKSDDPSLLIALSPTVFESAVLERGEVAWISPGAISMVAGHALRITFLPARDGGK